MLNKDKQPPDDDDTEKDDAANTSTDNNDSTDNKLSAAGLQAQLAALQKQLKNVNGESAARRKKIEKMEAAAKQKERAEMDELERLKAEMADLQAASAKNDDLSTAVDNLNAVIQAQVDAMVKDMDVPDHILTLLEAMPADKKLAYLTENRAAFTGKKKKKPNYNAGAHTSSLKNSRADLDKIKQTKRRRPIYGRL